ncbi:hypothetical protein ANCDUO_24478 [Ancylostoma duodenale]|uniref:Uncharacterized protein n=1 Tax=Ancylostoma duodenale TaxID=51022 RepID=A0A0C2FKU8_9BILA|nr:hypothetical protein ANCDUO_24478 [Ancylostoma duodenale]
MAEYRQVIPCLKNSEGKKVTSRLSVEAAVRKTYERLFRSSTTTAPGRMLKPLLKGTLPFTPQRWCRCLAANTVKKVDSLWKT